MNEVAITGVGIVSCLGIGCSQVAESLRAGRSGIVAEPLRIELGFQSPFTAVIPGFDPAAILNRKARKSMTEFGLMAYAATEEALAMAGLGHDQIQNERTGLIFGCDSSCLASLEQVDALRDAKDTRLIGSGVIFQSMTSTVTMNLNALLGTRGACWTISSACSSGGHAVGQSADLIRLGRQDRVICGGAQEINWQSMCSFDGLGAFSRWAGPPGEASRPFDRDRDGLVPGGGGAALVLERLDLAKARGARVLGTVEAYAFSSDGYHLSVPSGEGLERAMRDALLQAGLEPGDVSYICAHATATPVGDAVEAQAIARVFPAPTPWVSSIKSMTGHELWMAGASQAAYSVIMAREGFLAPNINFRNPDEHSARLRILTEALPVKMRHVLCNSAGFGGTNSCLILGFS